MRRHKPRHLKRPEPYRGWDPVPSGRPTQPLDEADALLAAQSGHTPPMPWAPPRVQVPAFVPPPPRPQMPTWARITIAGLSAMAGGFVVLVAMLALALYLDSTSPATADVSRETSSVTVIVEDGQTRLADGTYEVRSRR